MSIIEKKLARAEEELRLSEERFQLIVNGTIDGIWDWPDATKDELYWSPQWKALLGYKDHELTASKETFYTLLHPDDREPLRQAVTESLEFNKLFDIEYRLLKKSGEYGWFHGRGVVSKSAGITRMIGSIADISKRKQAEENNHKLLEKLIASNAELEQFTYIATHDLRSPLRHIVNFNSLLEKEFGHLLNNEGKEYIRISKESAMKMETVITDLLKYSQASQALKQTAQVDCNKIVHEILGTLKEPIQISQAKIHYKSLPTISANQLYFTILLQNIIGNAVKYQPPGKQPIIHVAAEENAESWQFHIADNGIGIKPEYLESIFAPFKRLHGEHEYKGSGLGLAICKRIVHGLGGRIWAESQFGEGSSFYFTIPK